MLYSRNSLYIPQTDQMAIKNSRVLSAGCGIGSNIVECALRLGFENFTLIDGDKVELSNLNRQNYRRRDIGVAKTEALRNRLLSINPEANISTYNRYLTISDLNDSLMAHNIAINALDFQSDIPFRFDDLCGHHNIAVIHPYNIGWATLVFVIMPGGTGLSAICADHTGFEKKVASFLIENISGYPKTWIQEILANYEEAGQSQPPPQLSVASWLAGGICTNLMYRLATGRPVRQFPDFYFVTGEEGEA